MALARKYASFPEPRRVQILRGSKTGTYFKPGQFAYALGWDERGGNYCVDMSAASKAGIRVYLVSKTKDARGGALWFTSTGIRFTRATRPSP